MPTIYVISIIFLLSLFGAVVLFKFFKSSALVKSEKYQAGGAVAGFIIIYTILFGSYSNITKLELEKIKENSEKIIESNKELLKKLEPKMISGKIIPYRKNTKVVLAIKETDPDSSGKFKIRANGINPLEDDIRVYIITEDGYIPVNIASLEEMTNLDIPLAAESN